MGLRIFLRNWDDFASKTDLGIVLGYFYGIEFGLRMFLSEEKREGKLDLKNFCSKRQKGERELDLN